MRSSARALVAALACGFASARTLVALPVAAMLAGACGGCLTATSERDVRNVACARALCRFRGTETAAVTGAWHGNVFTLTSVMRGTPETFTAVFVAPQMRLATLTLTPAGQLTWERAKMVPEAFDPEFLVFDLACVRLETAELAAALGEAWRVTETGRVRSVADDAGQTVLVRTREADGTVRVESPKYGYTYTIRPLPEP